MAAEYYSALSFEPILNEASTAVGLNLMDQRLFWFPVNALRVQSWLMGNVDGYQAQSHIHLLLRRT